MHLCRLHSYLLLVLIAYGGIVHHAGSGRGAIAVNDGIVGVGCAVTARCASGIPANRGGRTAGHDDALLLI